MVQRTNVRGIRQTGRAAQGVTLMNVRDEDRVSAVALVVESDGATAANVSDADLAAGPVELSADSGETEGVVGGAELTAGADDVVEFTDGTAGSEGADGRGPDNDGSDPDADIG
jgi:DNA gyrase subunit A